MAQKININIPKRSIAYLFLCLSGTLILIFFGVVPSYRSVSRLDREVNTLKLKIEENKNLRPVYQSMMASLQAKETRTFPFPERKPLPRSQSGKIFTSLSELAEKSGMRLLTISPDLTRLAGVSESLPLHVSVSGDFSSFRGFLMRLGGLPYLDDVEGLDIRGGEKGREYRVSLRLALGK